MMPLADVSQAYVQLEATPGTSFARTSEIAAEVERLLMKQPEVVKVSSEVGFEPGGTYFTGYSMGAVNAAGMMVTLMDSSKRKRSIWQVIDGVQRRGDADHPRHPAARHQGDGRGRHGLERRADPGDLLRPGSREALRAGRAGADGWPRRSRASTRSSTSWADTLPQLHVVVDRARAQEIGLTVEEVADQAYYALKGGLTNEFYRLDNKRQFTILRPLPRRPAA